jgi:hypothetical protein
MEQKLLNKEDIYSNYELANFEHCVEPHRETLAREILHKGSCVLGFLDPRKPSVTM